MRTEGVTAFARRVALRSKIEADAALKLAEAARKTECTNEINGAYASASKNQEEYDKQLLTLSSGFLVLSMAFVKDIVPMRQAVHLWLLYLSFIDLSVCVLAVLASYQISNHVLDKAKAYWENQKDGDKKALFPFGLAKLVQRWNLFSGILFFLGILLTVSFVVINLNQEAMLTKHPKPGVHFVRD